MFKVGSGNDLAEKARVFLWNLPMFCWFPFSLFGGAKDVTPERESPFIADYYLGLSSGISQKVSHALSRAIYFV